MRRSGPTMVAAAVGLVLALAGCTATDPPEPTSSAAPPTSTPAVTVTVTATATPTPTPTPTATPAESTGSTSAAGCSNGNTAIPPGSRTAQIGDIDGDGRADTEFSTADPSPDGSYGIRTAAGGVYGVRDGLAGPGAHGGWTAGLDASPGFVTVLDDGRQANLFVFMHCSWIRTNGVGGKPYSFGLAGFSSAGTGVACNDRNGGTLLEGVLAQKRADGRYDIRWTQIDVSSDGRTATNGATETRWSGLAASDPRVQASMGSSCGDAPKVYTDGK